MLLAMQVYVKKNMNVRGTPQNVTIIPGPAPEYLLYGRINIAPLRPRVSRGTQLLTQPQKCTII